MKKLIILIPVLLFICCSKPSTPQPQSAPNPLIGTWYLDSVYSGNQMVNETINFYDNVTFSSSTFIDYNSAYPNGMGTDKYSFSNNIITTSSIIYPGNWSNYNVIVNGNKLILQNTSVSNNLYYAYYHK